MRFFDHFNREFDKIHAMGMARVFIKFGKNNTCINMNSITFGIFGENIEKRQEIAGALAKKSTPEDITLYQTVYSGKIISVVEPTKYPEKIQSLAYSAFLSDYCIIVAETLTPKLGEIIVTLDLLGKKNGCIITNLDLLPMIAGSNLENYRIFSTFDEARESILAFDRQKDLENTPFASIDHSFEVKGVGSILLGFMHTGKISIHDRLKVHPSGKEFEVRSIQMHDVDVKETNAGDRFGLSIKLLASKDIERGDLVTPMLNKIMTNKEMGIIVKTSKFLKEPLKNDEQIHAFHFLADSPCRWIGEELKAGKEAKGILKFDKPFSLNPQYPALIVRLDAKGLRVIGIAKN
jgi:selenocysteine-specific translation elongation factor